MRLHSMIVAALVLTPGTAFALDPAPAAPSAAAAPQSPAPQPEAGPNGYRALAIAAGAVVGVVVVEYLTGGAITPMLGMAGPMAAPAAAAEPVAAGAAAMVEPVAAGAAAPAVEPAMAGPAATFRTGYMVAEGLAIAAGAVVGGYIGAWWYGK
jgi:hypothetical protein